jgi:hypothetical protein
MEAVCKGALEAEGTTVGVLPGADKELANAYVQIALATGIGEARNAVIARAADLLVAIGGEAGTLSEIALGLKFGKEVLSYRSWQLKPPQDQAPTKLFSFDQEAALFTALKNRIAP